MLVSAKEDCVVGALESISWMVFHDKLSEKHQVGHGFTHSEIFLTHYTLRNRM